MTPNNSIRKAAMHSIGWTTVVAIVALIVTACGTEVTEGNTIEDTALLTNIGIRVAPNQLNALGNIQAGAFNLKMTHPTYPTATANFQWSANEGAFLMPTHLSVPPAIYNASVTGTLTVPYADTTHPTATETITVQWAGTIQISIDPNGKAIVQTNEADYLIHLAPATARVAITAIVGAFGEGALPTSQIFTATLASDIGATSISWQHPIQPYSRAQISGETTIAEGQPLMILTGTTEGPYKDMQFAVSVPAGGITLAGGKQHNLYIVLDNNRKTGTITNATITDFTAFGEPGTGYTGITTAEDLEAFLSNPTSPHWRDVHGVIRLKADIDMIGKGPFTPIAQFGDVLDGGGFTITGLNISTSSDAAFFKQITVTGKVYGLQLAGIYILGSHRTGGIAAVNNGLIAGCSTEFLGIGGGSRGGIVAENNGTVVGCYTSFWTAVVDTPTGGITAGCITEKSAPAITQTDVTEMNTAIIQHASKVPVQWVITSEGVRQLPVWQ